MKTKSNSQQNARSFDDYLKERLTQEEIAEIKEQAQLYMQQLRSLRNCNSDKQNIKYITENTD